MSDLIDRECAIKKICEYGTYLERHGVPIITLCDAKQRAVDLIESLPSAQPERKKGKWIENSEPNQLGKNGVWYWKCSNCGHIGIGSFNFCPNCGADMRGESDD